MIFKVLTVLIALTELLVYPYVVSVSGECRLAPGAVQRARAAVAGEVQAVLVSEGQLVKRGDVLLRLDDTALRREMAHAVSMRAVAEHTLSHAGEHELRAAGNTMKATLRYWQDEVDRIQSALDFTVLRANLDGQVITPAPGELTHAQVESGQELIAIADTHEIVAEILVAERDIGDIAPGQKAFVRAYTDSSESHASVVQAIAPVAEHEALGTFIVVKARIDNTDQQLLPGTTGVAKIAGTRRSGFALLARKLARLFI